MLLATGAFSNEEEIPGADKHKVKVKFSGRVQVKYEADLHKPTNEWGSTGTGFAARRLRLGSAIKVGKVMRGLIQTDLVSTSAPHIQYAYLEFKTFGPVWLMLGKKNIANIMESSSSGKFLHGDANSAVGNIMPNIIFGAQIFGSVMKINYIFHYSSKMLEHQLLLVEILHLNHGHTME
jgi:hypothetical protein